MPEAVPNVILSHLDDGFTLGTTSHTDGRANGAVGTIRFVPTE
jgi:hypothetical protein